MQTACDVYFGCCCPSEQMLLMIKACVDTGFCVLPRIIWGWFIDYLPLFLCFQSAYYPSLVILSTAVYLFKLQRVIVR